MALADSTSGGNGDAPEYGDLVEEWACDEYDYEYVDETHYDAVTEKGFRVQIKGAMRWVCNGYNADGSQAHCRGRFKLFEGDHEALRADNGYYLLVVYEETEDGGIEPHAVDTFLPEEIEDVVDGDWYSEGDPRERSKGLVYRTTWPSFFPDEVA